MNIAYFSKNPHVTRSIGVEYKIDSETENFEKVTAELSKIGFNLDPVYAPALPTGLLTRFFVKKGTGLFNGWKKEEAEAFMKEASIVLAGLGFTKLSEWNIE